MALLMANFITGGFNLSNLRVSRIPEALLKPSIISKESNKSSIIAGSGLTPFELQGVSY
jgi:hypothetical protein